MLCENYKECRGHDYGGGVYRVSHCEDCTFKFKIGQTVTKPVGYSFPGTVVGRFFTTKGDVRYVVELEGYGLLHIFNEGQLI